MNGRINATVIGAVLVSTALFSGCQFVNVKDVAGNAIMGAKVDVIAVNGQSRLPWPSLTGLDGTAVLPKWGKTEPGDQIKVTKENYGSQQRPRPEETSVKIKLIKVRVEPPAITNPAQPTTPTTPTTPTIPDSRVPKTP